MGKKLYFTLTLHFFLKVTEEKHTNNILGVNSINSMPTRAEKKQEGATDFT